MSVVTDSNDIEQIQKAQDAQKALDRGLEQIMQGKASRGWMYDRLSIYAHVDACSHVPGCSDSTAFNEGARSVGTAILQEIKNAYPREYLKMLEEHITGQLEEK
jgi:hypothetical protein